MWSSLSLRKLKKIILTILSRLSIFAAVLWKIKVKWRLYWSLRNVPPRNGKKKKYFWNEHTFRDSDFPLEKRGSEEQELLTHLSSISFRLLAQLPNMKEKSAQKQVGALKPILHAHRHEQRGFSWLAHSAWDVTKQWIKGVFNVAQEMVLFWVKHSLKMVQSASVALGERQ